MVIGPEGVTAVASRFRVIQSMVHADTGSAEVTFDLAAASIDAGTADFEAFGAVYQAALATVDVARPTAATLPSPYGRMLDSVGPRALGIGATAAVDSMVSSMGPSTWSVGSVTGASSGTSIGQVGGYGKSTAPAELAPYGNGRIPTAALEPIDQGGHRLSAPAAQAWKACVEAARADLPAININLADGHYLRVAVSLGLHAVEEEAAAEGHAAAETSDEPSIPVAPAADIVLATFSGRTMASLATVEGREEAKSTLTAQIVEHYGATVTSVFLTEFVMQ